MRILHVHSGNRYGGVESVLRVMARAHGSHPPVQSAFALCYEGRLAAELRAAGSDVFILGEARASRPLAVLRARANLAAMLRHRHFDAVLIHSAWALSLLSGSGKPPLVFYQHDAFTGDHWTEKLARLRSPDLILANSGFTAASTSNVFPGHRARVLYPPAVLPAASLSPQQRIAVRARYAIPSGRVVILIAARFEKWKGHGLLLEALATLRQNPYWWLWVAGEPQCAAEHEFHDCLRVTAAGMGLGGRVQFLGHISNVPELMQAADIYCQPNTAPEPFGLVFVEALAAGLPIVATRLGGAREILEPAWGLLAEPRTSDVAAMIERLIEDPELRRRLAASGFERARTLCDPDRQMTALRGIIQSVCPRKAAA